MTGDDALAWWHLVPLVLFFGAIMWAGMRRPRTDAERRQDALNRAWRAAEQDRRR